MLVRWEQSLFWSSKHVLLVSIMAYLIKMYLDFINAWFQ